MHAMGSAKVAFSPSTERIEAHSFNPGADLELKFDRCIEVLLIALLAFVPWPFGCVHAWSQEVLIAVSALIAGCFVAKLLVARNTQLVRSWAYLPVILFCVLALAQLLPLSHSILHVVSPNTLETKSRLLADLPDAAAAPMSLTFYSRATWSNLRLLLVCVVVFVVALNVLRTRGRIKRMLIGISVVGGLVILLALAQDLSGTQKIYWTVAKPIPLAVGGPFIGHNDFPLFANLTIGSAIALLMVLRADRRLSRSKRGPMSAQRIAAICALVAVVALGIVAVFLSLSRSGIIALGAASLCISIIAAVRWRLGLERWTLAACVMFCLLASFYFASDSVNRRLATLQHPMEQYTDRWQINKDILAAWTKFPLFGTGLGTHEFVYPMFQRVLANTNFDHAEDEYAQMLEETGALGLGIVLVFVGLIIIAFFRAAKNSTHAPVGAATFGLGLGLLAIVIQSGFGFGAHAPANAVLIAIECALLLNVQRLLRREKAQPARVAASADSKSAHPALSFGLRLAGALGVLAAFGVSLGATDHARRAEAAWEPDHQIIIIPDAPLHGLSDDKYQDMIANAQLAHEAEPNNVTYLYWRVAFGWNALEATHDPNVAEDIRPSAEIAQIKRFVEQLNHIRKLCPTYGPALLLAGQLQYLALDQAPGLGLIRLAANVAPTNPDALLQLVYIDSDRGDLDTAMAESRHYLSLQSQVPLSFPELVDAWITNAKRPDLALQLAGDDPDRQLAVASALRSVPDRPDYQTLAASIEKKAKVARRAELVERCSSDDASAADLAALAEIYRSEHDLNRSIDCYQRALAKQYDQMDWHLDLAQALLAAGRTPEAVDEASICLRRQPHLAAAEQLIAQADSHGQTPDKP
jgi:tetratricopeptide (TPR) repeat protein/O-antigen ligase